MKQKVIFQCKINNFLLLEFRVLFKTYGLKYLLLCECLCVYTLIKSLIKHKYKKINFKGIYNMTVKYTLKD